MATQLGKRRSAQQTEMLQTVLDIEPPRVSMAESSAAGYRLFLVYAFDWLRDAPRNSVHAVVTDPPYGLVEYTQRELKKLRIGRGGVWRIPPNFDGAKRSALPRFTVLGQADQENLRSFFDRLACALMPVLVPGAHVFVATNPL